MNSIDEYPKFLISVFPRQGGLDAATNIVLC